jgi:hypothetical protein
MAMGRKGLAAGLESDVTRGAQRFVQISASGARGSIIGPGGTDPRRPAPAAGACGAERRNWLDLLSPDP